MSKGKVISGVVAFSNVQEHEVFDGQSTGRYSMVITMDEQEASKLSDAGVKVKEYEGTKQRKFASQYPVTVVDTEDNPVNTEVPYGSKVRVLYATGNAHPQHGVPTYLDRVRVVEFAEASDEVPEEF